MVFLHTFYIYVSKIGYLMPHWRYVKNNLRYVLCIFIIFKLIIFIFRLFTFNMRKIYLKNRIILLLISGNFFFSNVKVKKKSFWTQHFLTQKCVLSQQVTVFCEYVTISHTPQKYTISCKILILKFSEYLVKLVQECKGYMLIYHSLLNCSVRILYNSFI